MPAAADGLGAAVAVASGVADGAGAVDGARLGTVEASTDGAAVADGSLEALDPAVPAPQAELITAIAITIAHARRRLGAIGRCIDAP